MSKTKIKIKNYKLKCKVGDVILLAYEDAMPKMIVVTEIHESKTFGIGLEIASLSEIARIDSAEQIISNFGKLETLLAPALMINKGKDPSRPI